MNDINKLKIAFCQSTYNEDFEDTKKCIETVSPYVDCTIILYSEPINSDNFKWILDNRLKYNINIIRYEFEDNFAKLRNNYLELAKKLHVDWICSSDPDELFDEELAKNIRILIEKYDSEGYNNLAVLCCDQFSAIEWLDKLDMLKECPMGYRKTDFWKPVLIFKLYNDIHYEGTGIEKKAHETLVTKQKIKSINLPKEYFYVHKKSSLKIWRNAARNMFICGGGDNVGNKNKLWTELRYLCSQVGINNWNEFEHFINTGIHAYFYDVTRDSNSFDDIKNKFRLWLESALKTMPTKEGTETRETAKWYYALHKDEIDNRVKDLIYKVPDINKEIEIENFVTQMYYKILGRHPDEEGRYNYTKRLIEGSLSRKNFIDILTKSCEHKEKNKKLIMEKIMSNDSSINDMKIEYDNIEEYDEVKWNKVQEFIKKIYIKLLLREPDDVGLRYYTKCVMDKILKISDLPEIIKNSIEYKELKKYNSRERCDESKSLIVKKFELKSSCSFNNVHNTIALCIMGYHNGLSMILESINVVKGFVNEINIQGDDFTDEDIEKLKISGAKIYVEPWNDNFSDYKNKCCGRATTEWLMILDHDEVPTPEMAKEIRNIIKSSDKGNNYDMVSFNVIDIKTLNGKIISEIKSEGGKPLLHWNIPNPYYGNPHIWLKTNYYPWKEIRSNVAYKHIKEEGCELERSVRNVFMGGGGNNSKEKNPLWTNLRKVCDNLNIKTWNQFNEHLKKGDINRKILDIIVELSEMEWKDDELKDILKYYLMLHPEEKSFIDNKEYKQEKFGDEISWENHVNEVLREKVIYYPYNSDDEKIKLMHKYMPPIPEVEEFKAIKIKVLDAGCLIGRFINIIQGAGYDYTGIDQSQYAIDTAKRFNPNDKFIHGFLWESSKVLGEEQFDIVWMNAVMQHNTLPEKQKVIPELFKVLKHDGIFIMNESTVLEDTKTQLTYDNWINLIESFGFKFLESFHNNELGINDGYVFRKS